MEILSVLGSPTQSLQGVEKMSKLRELFCQETMIQDLEPLRNLTSLQKVVFNKTSVSSLAPLEKMENLYLLLNDTKISEKEIEQFKKSHPKSTLLTEF